ncbi:MAG: O-antigen ligase [Patescibacteria group bacterium]|nr:O-antigen ligase [Patescibacteria group bacterium]
MYFKYGQIAFGYDVGIYRHYIIGYFEKFGDGTLVPLGFSYFSNFFRFLGFSVDFIAYYLYIILSLGVFFAFYYIVKKFTNNKYIALIAIFLFSISVVQFEFFWWYYYRNFIALFFILLSFIFLQRKSFFLVFTLFIIAIIHPISFVFIMLVGFVYSFFDKDSRKFIWFTGLISLLSSVLINFREWNVYLLDYFLNKNINAVEINGVYSGQFLENEFFWKSVFVYLPFSIFGFWKFFKKYILFTIFTLISSILISVQVLFYKRIFVFFDISLIFFASIGIYDFFKFVSLKKKILKYIFIFFTIVYVVVESFYIVNYIFNKNILISKNDFSSIKSIEDSLPSGSYVLSFSSEYGPWLYGFTNMNIIAPGLFEYDIWTRDQWGLFWYANNKDNLNTLLSSYSVFTKTIYIYVGEKFTFFGKILDKSDNCINFDKYLWKCEL